MKRSFTISTVLLVACVGPERNVTQPVSSEVQPVPSPPTYSAVQPDAAPRLRRLHAEGTNGAVEVVICNNVGNKSLGLLVVTTAGSAQRIELPGTDAATPDDRVRLLDVDHDGLPDPLVGVMPDRRGSVVAPVTVFLTSTLSGSPNARGQGDCTESLTPDEGSEGFVVHAQSLDDAARMLAVVPQAAPTSQQACAYVEGATRSQFEAFGFPGSSGVLQHKSQAANALLKCSAKVRDGAGFLNPVMSCDSFRPFCRFGLASGDTSVPDTERRFWFDLSQKRLMVIGVPEL